MGRCYESPVFRLLLAAAALANVSACSARSGSNGELDASAFVASDAQPTYRGDPSCDVPRTPARSGACVTLGGAVMCNPVTQEPCAAGQECGPDNQGGTICRTPAPNQTLKVCDLSPGGLAHDQTCGAAMFATRSEATHEDRCALLCCDDSDCGSGQCVRYVNQAAPYTNVGECLNPVRPTR